MSENLSTSTDMVEVTDSLDAIAVFRGWKNVFLTLLILCLLVVQGGFWLVDQGIIKPEAERLEVSAALSEAPEAEGPDVSVALSEAVGAADANATEAFASQVAEPNEVSDHSASSFLKMDLKAFDLACLTKTLKVANGLMLLSGVFICLTLFFSVAITIMGRLGGIRHVCRAFFMSLIMLVLLLPWHVIFDSLVCGYLYRPEDLVLACAGKSTELLSLILHYLRFAGFWLVVCGFLIATQVHCRRWAKSIRRRHQIT